MKIKSTILFLLLVLVLSNCDSKKVVDYANNLDKCLEHTEIEFLNSLCFKFESHLVRNYDLPISEAYNQYLQDVIEIDFPQNFFNHPTFEEDMRLFRNSEFYLKTWVKESEINSDLLTELPPTESIDNSENEVFYDPMVLNPSSIFAKCIKNENAILGNYFDTVAGIDISPSLSAQVLQNEFQSSDLDQNLYRLTIAINLHYQLGQFVLNK